MYTSSRRRHAAIVASGPNRPNILAFLRSLDDEAAVEVLNTHLHLQGINLAAAVAAATATLNHAELLHIGNSHSLWWLNRLRDNNNQAVHGPSNWWYVDHYRDTSWALVCRVDLSSPQLPDSESGSSLSLIHI